MPFEESNSYLSNSMFLTAKYFSSEIPRIFWQCQFSNSSTPIIAWSTNFLAGISMLDKRGIIVLSLEFLMKSADTAPDGKYFTQQD